MFEKNKNVIIAVIVTALVVGSGSYYAGTKSGQQNIPSQRADMFTPGGFGAGMQPGTNGRVNRGSGAGVVSGQVIAKDATSMTIETRGAQAGQSGSKIVFLSGTTQVTKSIDGVADDIVTGKEVLVTGTTNTDGSITAKTIQIRPATTTASFGGGGRGMGTIPTGGQ